MNSTSAVAGVAVVIVVVAGFLIYNSQKTDAILPAVAGAVSTVSGSLGINAPSPVVTEIPISIRESGKPIVVTSSNFSPTDTTVIVTGTVNPNGALTNYWYEYDVTSDLNNQTQNQSVGSGYRALSSPAYITGLTQNTNYLFRVIAENTNGKVVGKTYSFKTTQGISAPVGSVPMARTTSASGITRTTATLEGEVNPNQAVTEYWFEYGRNTNFGNVSESVTIGNGSTKMPASLVLTNLDPLTTYYFRLNAQNQFGTVNGSIMNFKTMGPSTPVKPVVTTRSASNITATTATLRGTVNGTGLETTYWFEYGTDSLVGAVLPYFTSHTPIGGLTSNVSVSTDITGLKSRTTYYFRLVASNSLGTVTDGRQSFKTK